MEQTTMDESTSLDAVTVNPHVLWRQVTGLVLWTSIVGFIAGGPLGAVISLALGGVTFVDAWKSGIYKKPDEKSFLNISPMAWGLVMALVLIVAYPAYLITRNKLRTKEAGNGFFIALIVIGAASIAWSTFIVLTEIA